MSICLFAYGTLREGRAPREIADTAALMQPIGKGVARGRVYDLGAYPGAVFSVCEDAREIEGEVFEVPDEAVLRALDAYEGFEPNDPAASLFVRVRIEVQMSGTGESIDCWAYQYNRLIFEAAQ
jgi:gamma-glutamylcyclotransferase (GGCT)/AIG2-like uncharacterized protein YtfP